MPADPYQKVLQDILDWGEEQSKKHPLVLFSLQPRNRVLDLPIMMTALFQPDLKEEEVAYWIVNYLPYPEDKFDQMLLQTNLGTDLEGYLETVKEFKANALKMAAHPTRYTLLPLVWCWDHRAYEGGQHRHTHFSPTPICPSLHVQFSELRRDYAGIREAAINNRAEIARLSIRLTGAEKKKAKLKVALADTSQKLEKLEKQLEVKSHHFS